MCACARAWTRARDRELFDAKAVNVWGFAVLCLLKMSTASPSSAQRTHTHTHGLGVTEAIFQKIVHGKHKVTSS